MESFVKIVINVNLKLLTILTKTIFVFAIIGQCYRINRKVLFAEDISAINELFV